MATRLVLCSLWWNWCHFNKIFITGCAASDENFVKMTFPFQCWSVHQTTVAPVCLAEILDNFAITFLVFNFYCVFKDSFPYFSKCSRGDWKGNVGVTTFGAANEENFLKMKTLPFKPIFDRWRFPHWHDCSNASADITLQWRHNGCDSVSNHQPHDCLLNRLFRHRSKKTSKLRVTGLCAGNSTGTGEFPAQMASNAENVSIWWRHHDEGYAHTKTQQNTKHEPCA